MPKDAQRCPKVPKAAQGLPKAAHGRPRTAQGQPKAAQGPSKGKSSKSKSLGGLGQPFSRSYCTGFCNSFWYHCIYSLIFNISTLWAKNYQNWKWFNFLCKFTIYKSTTNVLAVDFTFHFCVKSCTHCTVSPGVDTGVGGVKHCQHMHIPWW